jgi:hypothetical protein
LHRSTAFFSETSLRLLDQSERHDAGDRSIARRQSSARHARMTVIGRRYGLHKDNQIPLMMGSA